MASVRGASVSISFWFLLLIAAAIYLGKGTAIPLIVAIILHELAHLAAIALCGYKIRAVKFTIKGIQIDISAQNKARLTSELIISFAGPLVGLLTAWAFFALKLPDFGYVSVILSLFNLLPIAGLDGGKILLEVLIAVSPVYGQSICDVISFCTILILMLGGLGIYMVYPQLGQLLIAAGAVLMLNIIFKMPGSDAT